MITFIYQDLIIEFKNADELFNDPLFIMQKERLELENQIREINQEKRLLKIIKEYHISNIEKNLGFSLDDKDAKTKLNHLSKTIKIPYILYQYAA